MITEVRFGKSLRKENSCKAVRLKCGKAFPSVMGKGFFVFLRGIFGMRRQDRLAVDFRNARVGTAGCGFWKAPPEGGHGFRETLAELIE